MTHVSLSDEAMPYRVATVRGRVGSIVHGDASAVDSFGHEVRLPHNSVEHQGTGNSEKAYKEDEFSYRLDVQLSSSAAPTPAAA